MEKGKLTWAELTDMQILWFIGINFNCCIEAVLKEEGGK